MEDNYKEVYFGVYCKTCQYKGLNESEDPCDECLGATSNLYSHKPINYNGGSIENERIRHNTNRS